MLTGPPQVRRLLPGDEEQARAAHAELADEGFDFLLGYDDGEDFAGYLDRLAREERGSGLAPGRVAHTLLVAMADDTLVGRVSLRHELTPMLAAIGGHIGYAVRPGLRRRGYASILLRAALRTALGLRLEQVLVTCDDDNGGSIAVIERCGGVLEDTIELLPGQSKRRYWLATACPPSSALPGKGRGRIAS